MSSKAGRTQVNFKRCVRLKVKQARHCIFTCSVACQAFRAHAHAVALVLNRLRDPIAKKDLRLDLSIMESTLVLLMGSMMSKEGQAAFESPIR